MRRNETAIPLIESTQNPKIRSALELRESRSRRQRKEFLIEGRRELDRAIQSAIVITDLFIGDEFVDSADVREFLRSIPNSVRLARVSTRVYEKLALREGTEGLIAVAKDKLWNEAEILRHGSILVIMDGLEKPGNIGAVLRSMDGSGAAAMLLSSESTVDVYNPNAIRASQGAIFSIPLRVLSPTEILATLRENRYQIFALDPAATSRYFDADLRGACALVVGNEAHGLSDFWRKAADSLINIPMSGICDSLNASVSTAIVLYEALRQRRSIR